MEAALSGGEHDRAAARMRVALQHALAGLSIALISTFLHSLSINYPDPDSFYHLKHAQIYAERGIGYAEFPWLEHSIVGDLGGDLWYGFHVLLIPLAGFQDLQRGLIFGGVACTSAALGLAYWSLVRLGVSWPLLWTAVFCFAAGPVTYRLMMLRPHGLSLGLSLVIFAVAVEHPTRRRLALAFALAAASAWIHLVLSWLPLLFALAAFGQRAFGSRRSARPVAAVAAGLLLGWLLRPRPGAVLHLARVVLVDVLEAKRQGIPLLAGRELWPLSLSTAWGQCALIAGLVALILVWRLFHPDRRPAPWTLLALSCFFGLLAVHVAARSLDLAVGTAVLFAAAAGTSSARANPRPALRAAAVAAACVLMAAMPVRALPNVRNALARGVYPPEFREVSRWLQAHTSPGAVVFHLHWDQFAQLFFWNSHNHYVNGMDPILAYAHDPRRYWQVHMLAIDASPAFTCGEPICLPTNSEPTPLVIARDFRASHVLVKKIVNPRFEAYCRSSPSFEVVFDNGEEVVFRLVPAARSDAPAAPAAGGA